MSQAGKADVVVVVADPNASTMMRCLKSVLEHSGPALHRLIVVASSNTDSEFLRCLETMAQEDSRVHLLGHSGTDGDVAASNLGLARREADAVLLRSNLEATPGWLDELADVVNSGPRTACAAPLTSHDGYCSVESHDSGDRIEALDEVTVRAACANLPRWTVVPRLPGICLYLRGDVIDAVGLLDSEYQSGCGAAADWIIRAQSLGFLAKRANHVFLRDLPSDQSHPRDNHDLLDRDPALLSRRHPHLEPQLKWFETTLDRSLALHAVRLRATGRLRVAYDLRELPHEQVGTRTYTVSLVKALSELPEIDLTLLVREPAQAQGLDGRVVTPENWKDDVAVIHRPMQVVDPRDLRLFHQSSAHLIITYQDLIGYRIPRVFPSDAEFHSYRATSCLSLQGVQRILAYSESAAQEIVEEFGIPREEVEVVPLGVDAALFSRRDPRDAQVFRKLGVPRRYFFSIATDFPHKNLHALLNAYALFRARWNYGKPPGLVMAGYATGGRGGLYKRWESESLGGGLTFLGPVSPDQLRVLYQRAEALIFPSLYEGFGLPPLEAMAAGTSVIAMPISSVPEVGGNCVLYPDGLSVNALVQAMERLVMDDAMRAGLCARGLEWVRQFTWENTARATLEVYRSAVLRPSDRSLAMRRRLREAILTWSDSVLQQPTSSQSSYGRVIAMEPLGIRTAWKALNLALQNRLRREMDRISLGQRRRSA